MIFDRHSIRIRVAAMLFEKNRILLIAHKKEDNIYWLLPGGGVKFGETLKDALCREIREELGILININKLALISDAIEPDGDRHIINICFHCSYKGGDFILGSDNRLFKYDFFTKSEIKNLKLFPPINNEIIKILDGENIEDIYLQKEWIPL